VITLASRRDLHHLLCLVRAYHRFEGIRVRQSSAAALRQLVTTPALGRAWIVRDRGRAVGYAILTFNFDVEFGGLEGILTDLYLRPGYRGRGLGRRLVDIASGYCRSRGVEAIELQVAANNEAAQAFYRRLGFERLSRLVMACELSR
jgi:ribosomal protein S18 acetylase RimI-like enzyme